MDLKEVKTKKNRVGIPKGDKLNKLESVSGCEFPACLFLYIWDRKALLFLFGTAGISHYCCGKNPQSITEINGWRRTQKNSALPQACLEDTIALLFRSTLSWLQRHRHSSGPDGHSPLRKESSFLSVYPKFSKQPCLLGTQGTWTTCTLWCTFSILPTTTNRSLAKWAARLFSGILLAQLPPIKSLVYHYAGGQSNIQFLLKLHAQKANQE